jgi:hypothetical protein
MSEMPQTLSTIAGQTSRDAIFFFLLAVFICLTTSGASGAVKFKRFSHCPEGLVSKKTCECHAGASGRFHFCHAGQYCDSTHGFCHK